MGGSLVEKELEAVVCTSVSVALQPFYHRTDFAILEIRWLDHASLLVTSFTPSRSQLLS